MNSENTGPKTDVCTVLTLKYVIIISLTDVPGGTTWNYWTMKAWGVNLGNWLVLEKWMDPAFFSQYAPNAVDEWTFTQQAANAAQVLAAHWNSWVTEDDFR